MSTPTPDELLALLRRFAMERDRYVKLLARRAGMGRAEFDALDYIEEAGEMTPNQLSDRLFLTSGATTALIDRLEAAGQLVRSPHPTDRRSLILRLTPRSDETGARRLSPYMRDLEAAALRLDDEGRAAVGAFLEAALAAAITNAEREAARAATKKADVRAEKEK
jgi:DNA-binding MarR family transcriptional regulator